VDVELSERLVDDFWSFLLNLNVYLKSTLFEAKDKKIYIFGAHIFAQILLRLESLNQYHIYGIIDNSERKQGKYLYGTEYLVSSPEILMGVEHPLVICFAGSYTGELLQQILSICPSCYMVSSLTYANYPQKVSR
jgi:hypothetical protein